MVATPEGKERVRLSASDIVAVKSVFRRCFLEGDEIWIFGSRVDLMRKGGDIDLYIETSIENTKEAIDTKLRFLSDLKQKIGDQKIDVVLNVKALNHMLPIYKMAKLSGVRLV